jgi:hypothetical protein
MSKYIQEPTGGIDGMPINKAMEFADKQYKVFRMAWPKGDYVWHWVGDRLARGRTYLQALRAAYKAWGKK